MSKDYLLSLRLKLFITLMQQTLEPLMELCTRYKSGIRGQMKKAVCELVEQYLSVEKLFQVSFTIYSLPIDFLMFVRFSSEKMNKKELKNEIVLLFRWASTTK